MSLGSKKDGVSYGCPECPLMFLAHGVLVCEQMHRLGKICREKR